MGCNWVPRRRSKKVGLGSFDFVFFEFVNVRDDMKVPDVNKNIVFILFPNDTSVFLLR